MPHGSHTMRLPHLRASALHTRRYHSCSEIPRMRARFTWGFYHKHSMRAGIFSLPMRLAMCELVNTSRLYRSHTGWQTAPSTNHHLPYKSSIPHGAPWSRRAFLVGHSPDQWLNPFACDSMDHNSLAPPIKAFFFSLFLSFFKWEKDEII